MYNETTAIKIMEGKHRNRAVRAHRLVLEVIWRLSWNSYLLWKNRNGDSDSTDLNNALDFLRSAFGVGNESDTRIALQRATQVVKDTLQEFDDFMVDNTDNSTFKYWKEYIDIIGTGLSGKEIWRYTWKCSRKCYL